MKNISKKHFGFTLVELMIVVAIIGVLASIAIPNYQDYVTRTKWAKTIATTRALRAAIELCLADNAGFFGQCDTIESAKPLTVGKGLANAIANNCPKNQSCNTLTSVQAKLSTVSTSTSTNLAQYAGDANATFSDYELLSDSAIIRIVGDVSLGNCTLLIVPYYEAGLMGWQYVMKGSGAVTAQQCTTYVTTSIASA